MFKLQTTMAKAKQQPKEVSLLEYADKHNKVLTRRGHKMSFSYLYRLIREHRAGKLTRELWFEYKLNGDKEIISIILN